MNHDDTMAHHDHEPKMSNGMMMLKAPRNYGWAQAAILLLGVWLLTSPLCFTYGNAGLMWSDFLSGGLAILIALATLKWRPEASYLNTLLGIWLLFAPLVFWTDSPALYNLDTLIGALLITFSFLFPMSMNMGGPAVPKGWSYNPSSWPQRAPAIALAFVGFFTARYMASFQLGHIPSAWDPFFGSGTEHVLTSKVSKMFPISDAGLGALTYLIEGLSGFMGDERRWRTMPWMVAIFGIAVIPLGIVSIILMMLQPVSVGNWCTLCLFSAFAMLLMLPLALDEVVAMIQFLNQSRKRGHSVWRTFWAGGGDEYATDEPTPARKPQWTWESGLWGATSNWGLLLSALLSVLLLFVPDWTGASGWAANATYILATLALTIVFLAFAEVGRPARFINLFFAICLLACAVFMSSAPVSWRISSASASVLLFLFSLPLGAIQDRYGTYQVWAEWNPLHGRPHQKPPRLKWAHGSN